MVGLVACADRCVDTQTDAANCGRCGAACAGGQSCNAGRCEAVATWSASWTYPVLVQPPSGGPLFPAYIAHLIGRPVTHPAVRPLACARLVNPTSARQSITLRVELPGYTVGPVEQTVGIEAGRTLEHCLTPTFDYAALRRLTAPIGASVQVGARDASGLSIPSSRALTVLPLNNVLWNSGTGPIDSNWAALSAVTVQSTDRAVMDLLNAATAYSRTGSLQYGYMFTGNTFDRTVPSLSVGYHQAESIYVEPGETYDLSLNLRSVSGGLDADLNVYLFTTSQYQAWAAGTGTAALAAWVDQRTGARPNFRISTAGAYVVVLHNTSDNYVSRSALWTRANTRHDHAIDALKSLYSALYRRGVIYQDLTSTYFAATGGQRIRLPAETFAVSLANCIDGTVLFAAALELAGFSPHLFLVQGPGGYGHAYVGVQLSRSGTVVAPLETTLVMANDFNRAYSDGLTNLSTHSSDLRYRLIDLDLRQLRTLGLSPIP